LRSTDDDVAAMLLTPPIDSNAATDAPFLIKFLRLSFIIYNFFDMIL
jgi:hypothetical protein